MSTESSYSRKNPFLAALKANRKLTVGGSNKDTRHLEISLAGSGLVYEAGDSLAVFPVNDPVLVDLVIRQLGFTGEEALADTTPGTIREALSKSLSITDPSKPFLQAVAAKDSRGAALTALMEPDAKQDLEKFLWGRDVLDVLQQFSEAGFSPEEFVKLLRKLQPRLYSVASSQRAVGESVHLTLSVVRYGVEHSPRPRGGVCSTFLAERAQAGASVFVHRARHFHLPEDPSTPIIMVGAGTGVAPFRAFLQDRKSCGQAGPAWLIFGEQHAATDFLYQEEFEVALAEGTLTRLTTAFSRDQSYKIYVQHRMREHGAELFAWLQRGAYFYMCGDAKSMAKDVDETLLSLIETHGKMFPAQARDYVATLKKEKRYRKDIY